MITDTVKDSRFLRFFALFPKNYAISAWSSDTSVTSVLMKSDKEHRRWIRQLREFYRTYGIDFDYTVHFKQLTVHDHTSLATYNGARSDNRDTNCLTSSSDPAGQGWQLDCRNLVFPDEFSLSTGGHWRRSFMCAGGGGVAGGASSYAGTSTSNTGYSVVGDWEWKKGATGTIDSCMNQYGYSGNIPGTGWAHEFQHGMGMLCHQNDVFPDGSVLPVDTSSGFSQSVNSGDVLYVGQYKQMALLNFGFCRPYLKKEVL